MFKKLFLLVIVSASAHTMRSDTKPVCSEVPVRTVSWTPVKQQSASEIVGNSIKYTLENPIKIIVGSLLVLNLCIHGKQSIVCKGIKWTTKDLPKIITGDCSLVIDSLASLSKNSYKFFVS